MRKERILEQDKSKKEKVADLLTIPKDILLGCSILSAIGNREIRIENYKGIIEYNEDIIYLQGKHEKILIEGKSLSIDYYSNEDMRIVGSIKTIKYL